MVGLKKQPREAESLRSKDGQKFNNLQIVEQFQNNVPQCEIDLTGNVLLSTVDNIIKGFKGSGDISVWRHS